MKTAWTRMKGVCLLLLGLATTGGGRSFAAEINTVAFATLAESSSATTAGTAVTTPFKEESAVAPAKAVPVEPVVPPDSPSRTAENACQSDPFCGAPGRFWFRGEYLHWWTSGAHLPPMVSTIANFSDYENGAAPVYSTVFGDRDVYQGNHDGYRMDFGMWLDCCHCWGLEADYFDLSGRPCGYDSGLSNGYADGNPFPIGRPYYDPGTNPDTGQPIGVQLSGVAYPSQYVGRVVIDTNDYFQSAGIWLRRQLRACEWSTSNDDVNWTNRCARTFRLDAIGGYRFARLIDRVDAQDSEEYTVYGTDAYLTQYSEIDSYRTVNNFNGADLGLNVVYTFGRWSVDVVGKAAIGFNNQYVKLYGASVQDASNSGGGVYAASSTQEYSRNRFSAIPDLTVTLGYQVMEHLKFTVGYDLLYWTAVVRAADQIAVEPTTGYAYGTQVGSTLPPFSFNESHFLAQGLHLGGEFRF